MKPPKNSLNEYGENKSLDLFIEIVFSPEEEQLGLYNVLLKQFLGNDVESN